MKQIRIAKTLRYFLVDDEDYEKLKYHRWYYSVRGVVRTYIDGKAYSVPKIIFNNQFIYDHIDGNKFNNQKSNLRIATKSQNGANRKKTPGLSSKYKGVTWSKWNSKWEAQIYLNRRRIHLGYFIKEEDAALAYNKAAIKYFGEFAYLNVIEEGQSDGKLKV